MAFPSVSDLIEQFGHAEEARFDFAGMVQLEVMHESFDYEIDQDGYYTIKFSWGEDSWHQSVKISMETLDATIDFLTSGTEIEFNDPVNEEVVNLWIELRDDRENEDQKEEAK